MNIFADFRIFLFSCFHILMYNQILQILLILSIKTKKRADERFYCLFLNTIC